jgi:hypothetical protein
VALGWTVIRIRIVLMIPMLCLIAMLMIVCSGPKHQHKDVSDDAPQTTPLMQCW